MVTVTQDWGFLIVTQYIASNEEAIYKGGMYCGFFI